MKRNSSKKRDNKASQTHKNPFHQHENSHSKVAIVDLISDMITKSSFWRKNMQCINVNDVSARKQAQPRKIEKEKDPLKGEAKGSI